LFGIWGSITTWATAAPRARTSATFIRDCSGRDLACLLFGAAAWKVKAQDGFIGWSAEQRQERLALIVNNSRFLILPDVRVPHLASRILGTILSRLRSAGGPDLRPQPTRSRPHGAGAR
jgi:Domain of unknown function (DUF4338)